MLSCNDVLEALPGIEAGEPASGAVRDHLAGCEGCRAEAGRLRADLGVIRRDLAALASSPLLEDAVIETARATQAVGARAAMSRRSSLWLGGGIALAAASLLVAVLLVTRNEEQGDVAQPGGPDGEAPLVWFPPSASEVVAARKGNPPNFDYGGRDDGRRFYRHWYRNADRGLTTFAKETLEPLVPGLAHRWVFVGGEQGERRLSMVGVPPRGVQVLGKAILDRVGGEQALTGFKEYMGEEGVKVAEIEVGTPGPGGARARIEVVLRPDYDGTLLLEEPLARALGLYQYEIPGGCRIDGDLSTKAHRARARLVIERSAWDPKTKEPRDLPDFDDVVEVQVRRAGEPLPAPALARGAAPGTMLRFEGERPQNLMMGRSMRVGADSWKIEDDVKVVQVGTPDSPQAEERFVEVPVDGTGALLVTLAYEARDHPLCRVLLPPIDRTSDWPRGYRFDLERVTLAGRFEPGAHVVVGRVWRGATAIPSRESVALTTVADDGTVSFVRHAGEAGDGLRMRVQPKGGKARWVEVNLRKRQLVVNLMKSGEVAVKGYVYNLVGDDTAAALKALREQLADLVRHSGRRDERGVSDLEVLIHAEREVPWRHVQWVMQTCAHPDVRLRRLRFQVMGRADAPLRNDLPVDRGLMSTPTFPADFLNVKIRVFRRNQDDEAQAYTMVKIGNDRTQYRLPEAWRGRANEPRGRVAKYDAVMTAIRKRVHEMLREHRGKGQEVKGKIVAPPPKGGGVPYGDVVKLLEILQTAGVTQVLFEGAAMPR